MGGRSVLDDFKTKRELLKKARKENDVMSAYKYVEYYGDYNKKTMEMAQIVMQNWTKNEDIAFSDVKHVAEKCSLQDDLEKSVQEFVSSKDIKNISNDRLFGLAYYALDNNMKNEFEVLESVMMSKIYQEEDVLDSYIKLFERRKLEVNPYFCGALICAKDDGGNIEKLMLSCPNKMDYRKLLLTKIDNAYAKLEQDEKNGYKTLDNLYRICLTHKDYFNAKEYKNFVEIALTTKELHSAQNYVLEKMNELEIKPKLLEKCVLDNERYDYAVKVANIKGVDAEKIEKKVLEEKDFWLSYSYAMNVEGANKKKHLEVMNDNIPEVKIRSVSYWDAYNAVDRGQRLQHKILGEMEIDDVKDVDVARKRGDMQSKAIEEYKSKIAKQNEAIKTLKKSIADDEKAKKEKIQEANEKKVAKAMKTMF